MNKGLLITVVIIILTLASLVAGCTSPKSSQVDMKSITIIPTTIPTTKIITTIKTTASTTNPTQYPTSQATTKLTTISISSSSEVCSCTGDLYKCEDFPTKSAAQACFDYCKSLGKGDIHGLDRDKDGRACE